MEDASITIKSFDWKEGWPALWELRTHQLAEEGIIVAPEEVGPPDLDSSYERDYHRIDQVYLTGTGGFWIAWWDDTPVGHIAAQDVGDGVELRHMYVRAAYRRRGIGTQLVRELIAHCAAKSVKVIELWTAHNGLGRILYEKAGFRVVDGPEMAFEKETILCPHIPSEDETRMRFLVQS